MQATLNVMLSFSLFSFFCDFNSSNYFVSGQGLSIITGFHSSLIFIFSFGMLCLKSTLLCVATLMSCYSMLRAC